MGKDGSAYLAGRTYGPYNKAIDDDNDFAAVKLDSDGNVLWRWQVRNAGRARIQPLGHIDVRVAVYVVHKLANRNIIEVSPLRH